LRSVLERAVDEFIDRAEDEDLLDSSARVARQTGLREADAAEIVRGWRRSRI
jgi:pantoate kinase